MLRLVLIIVPLSIVLSGCFDSRRRTDGGTPPPQQDGEVACGLPTVDCGLGICVNLNSDPQNCGACGMECGAGAACVLAACVSCTPSCEGAICGDDGCGGSCGSCPAGFGCTDGACTPGCTPDCADAECGDDGCGGSCGTCFSEETCSFGSCVSDCTPSCSGLECGDDGCGGSCGTCLSGETCLSGLCMSDTTPGGGESCFDATLVSASGGEYSFSFTGRSADHTPFTCSTTTGQPDVAFRFTPTFSGSATFETGGSIDTVMAVFSSSSCTSELGCDDDGSASGTNSLLTLTVTSGTTYYIVIAPYGSSTPTGTVTLTVTAP